MKKLILTALTLMLLSFTSQKIIAQEKFGYVILSQYASNNNLRFIMSGLIDLSKLDCKAISRKNQYGTQKSKVEIYQECITNEFKRILKSRDVYFKPTEDFWTYVQNDSGYGCPYGNEDPCFMTKEKAKQQRQSKIDGYKRNGSDLSIIE